MARLDEGTRWHWQSPIPPMFGQHAEPIDQSLMPHIVLYRTIAALGLVLAALMVWSIVSDLMNPTRSSSHWKWLIMPITSFCLIMAMNVIERHISNKRGPSKEMESALATICSMSDDMKKTVMTFRKAGVLTFKTARELIQGNQHLLTKANSIVNAQIYGPQPMCDRTGGPSLSFEFHTERLVFDPHADGWYRAAVTNSKLHQMLCAGAAGPDAGVYWVKDATQGLWALPASFIEKLPSRLAAMSNMMPAKESRKPTV